MAACVETMFSVRETPWHGLGLIVEDAPSSADAIRLAGLDWEVISQPLMTTNGIEVPGYFANVRDSDHKVLGVVGGQYTIVQNRDAFAMSDSLLGEGVRYETAGSLQEGKRIWLLARLPEEYSFMGDKVTPYMVLTNTHDGTGALRVAMTPVRVVCQNTLNMALSSARRQWSAVHKASVTSRIDEAKHTLGLARDYMTALNAEMETLAKIKLSPITLEKVVLPNLIKVNEDTMSPRQIESRMEQRAELRYRYLNAPDLSEMPKSGYRFINAVADFVDHSEPGRKTKGWQENRFAGQIQGNPLLDEAKKILLSVA